MNPDARPGDYNSDDKVLGILEEVRSRRFKLFLTLDPQREGHGPEANTPEVEILKQRVLERSASLIGLLITRGYQEKNLGWLEDLAGPGASVAVHLHHHPRGQQEQPDP